MARFVQSDLLVAVDLRGGVRVRGGHIGRSYPLGLGRKNRNEQKDAH